jgi:3-oxoacyl-[acyl-carrier-protein] synthase III
MAILSVPHVRLKGLSACVPSYTEHNMDYHWISKKERENLIKTTGVEKRHIRAKGQTTSDFCYEAALVLMDALQWKKDEIELLVLITQSADYVIPATACILQDRLGFSHHCMAFDINLGCSAYVYGLSIVSSMMSSGMIKKALLMTGDTSSIVPYRDKSTYPLFGDAGSVTALEFDPKASPMHFNLQSDGSGYKAIIIPDGGTRNMISRKSFDYKKYGKGIYRNNIQVALDGIEVFNFSLREVAPNIKKTLNFLNMNIADIDYFVFHQANKLINETIRKILRLEKEKMPTSLNEFGNTSSASIPLTMIYALQKELVSKKLTFSLSGFGVGLSWGTAIVQTDTIIVPDLIEI